MKVPAIVCGSLLLNKPRSLSLLNLLMISWTHRFKLSEILSFRSNLCWLWPRCKIYLVNDLIIAKKGTFNIGFQSPRPAEWWTSGSRFSVGGLISGLHIVLNPNLEDHPNHNSVVRLAAFLHFVRFLKFLVVTIIHCFFQFKFIPYCWFILSF